VLWFGRRDGPSKDHLGSPRTKFLQQTSLESWQILSESNITMRKNNRPPPTFTGNAGFPPHRHLNNVPQMELMTRSRYLDRKWNYFPNGKKVKCIIMKYRSKQLRKRKQNDALLMIIQSSKIQGKKLMKCLQDPKANLILRVTFFLISPAVVSYECLVTT
jgi:hypothetical protein